MEEERRRKLEAGRARLAHFQQRKTKGDGSHPPKKASKRKDASVRSHDLPAQEHPLGVQSEGPLADSEINANIQNKISSVNTDLIDLTMDASTRNTTVYENVDFMDLAMDANTWDTLSEHANLMDLEMGAIAGSMLSENIDLLDAVHNQTFSESTDLTDASMDDTLHNQSFTENTDLTDATIDTSLQTQSFPENANLVDLQMVADAGNNMLSENINLLDAIHNQTLFENTDLTDATMDDTLHNQTSSGNTEITDATMDASLQNQTFPEYPDLTDAAMEASAWNTFSECAELTDVHLKAKEDELNLDLLVCPDWIRELEEKFAQKSDVTNRLDEEDDLHEQLSEPTGSQDGHDLPEQTGSQEVGDLQDQLYQQSGSQDVEDLQKELSYQTGSQDGEDLLFQSGSQKGVPLHNQCFQDTGSQEVEDLKEQLAHDAGSQEVDDMQEHSGCLVIMQELEAALQDRNAIIYQLSSNLQQALQSRDEFQGEALLLATQLQALQQRMKEANEFMKSKSPRKPDLSQSQQQIALFQDNLQEQSSRLHMLGEKALEMERQLEVSEKNTKEKEKLLAQMEGMLKGTEDSVQQLHQNTMEQEEAIKCLQDELDLSDGKVYKLQQALSLREKQVTELQLQIASVRQKEESTINENDARLQELEAKHQQKVEWVRSQLCADSSDQNSFIGNLNHRLHESETLCESLRRKLEDQMEEFQRERSAAELRYRDMLADLTLQLNRAEEQAEEVVECKHDKERLNEEIRRLQGQLLLEAESSEFLRRQHDEEIQVYAGKLQNLQQEKDMRFQELVESHKADLEMIQSELSHRYDGELQLLRQELALQHGLRVDTFNHDLEDLKKSLNQVKLRKTCDDHKPASFLRVCEGGVLESSIDDDLVMAKYLAHTTLQEHSALPENSVEAFDCELSPHGRFELDGELVLEPSLNSTVNYEPFCSPLPIADVLAGHAAQGKELDAESFAVYLSRPALPAAELSDIENLDDDKACLIQRCYVLIKQLEQKDQELRASSEALQEAQQKRKDVTDNLLAAHEELALYKQDISWKRLQGSDLENQIRSLEKQHEQDSSCLSCTGLLLQTQDLNCLALQESIKELQQEREMLLGQLRDQEQLVKDVQEQKMAGDSVTSEVQSLFGRQLAVLQSQRDQLHAQLQAHKARNVITSELLDQNSMLEDSLRKEQDSLRSVISDNEESLTQLLKEKSILQERLSSVEQRLEEAEQAHEKSIKDQAQLESSHAELMSRIEDLEGARTSARLEYDFQLNAKDLEHEVLAKELKGKETQYSLKEQELTNEVEHLRTIRTELESRLQEAALGLSAALQEAQAEVRSHCEAEMKRMGDLHSQKVKDIQVQHQMEVDRLKSELDEGVKLLHLEMEMEGERKEQIGIIKQVHEREHDREMAELVAKHRQEMDRVRAALTMEQQHLFDELQKRAGESHEAELKRALLQAQTLHHLEMEALRLSLTNMHTAHLELSQSNLQKERETSLVELREMLNGKRAQEVALLQSRHQFDLERIREQHGKDMEEQSLKHQREMDKQKQTLDQEWSVRHEQTVQALRRDLEAETEVILKDLRAELLDSHHVEREGLRAKLTELQAKLESLFHDKEHAQMRHENLQNKHHSEVKDLQEQLQVEHEQRLQEGQMREDQQQQMEKVKAAYEELKTRSEQELKQLWSQLDSTRTSRQELSELREQLLARTSHVAEIERAKQDFELQRQQLKAAHETELEQLRLYFEQKLRATEENYREELTLLHQRLRDARDETVEEPATELSASALLDEISESRNRELLEQVAQQLEQHKEELMYVRLQAEERHHHEVECVRSSLALQFKEDLLNLKLQLSDQCISEIEALKKKHCLELEQLRAKLSDQHIREITKLHMQSAQDAARQVEAEVAARVCVLEGEHQARLALLQSEKQRIADLEDLAERLKCDHDERAEDLCEPQVRLREELEQVTCRLLEQCRQDVERARATEVQQKHHAEEAEWKQQREEQSTMAEEEAAERKRRSGKEGAQAQEKPSLICTDLQQQAVSEKMALTDETEMKRVQEEQAARIVELEKRLKEQQNSLRQLEDNLASERATQKDLCAQYERELASAKASAEGLRQEYTSKLKEAEIRSMEEQRAKSEALSSQNECALLELRQQHLSELRSQGQHRAQMESLPQELHAEHRAKTQALRAELESQQEAQLEAHLAELQAAHQAQIDELEAKHLSNLDTLESSYLSEIQTIRDEHKQSVQDLEVCLSQRLQEKEEETARRLASEAERLQAKHDRELLLAKDELRKELSTLHLETLQAMAAELAATHGEDLNEALRNQRALLETDHCQALDMVREEVLKMEEQHKRALQELHTADLQQQRAEREQQLAHLRSQHEQQQQMRTLEAETLRMTLVTQLEEKSKQLLHLQEEMEQLKCQSEMLLEQQISQLKVEFEAERKSSLHEKEQFERDAEHVRSLHQQARDQLLEQIQEKTEIIFQLEEKVCSLNQKMEESHLQLETLVQRRERENQECEALVGMLRSDADAAHKNQKCWQDSYQRVLKLITEMVRSTIATEDLISRKVGLCLDDSLASGGAGSDTQSMTGAVGVPRTHKDITEHEHSEQLLDSPDCDTMTDHSLLSTLTDEGCELSEHLCESLFGGPELLVENEVRILKISQRLRTAVERLLELVRDSTKQLEQTHEIQAHFEEEFNRRNQETAYVVQQQQDLLQRLNEESEGKNQLALQLHKAQGVIEGYAAEKAALEEALNEKEDSRRSVVVDLEQLREEFQALTREQALLREEHNLLRRQKAALGSSQDGMAADLLRELERVSQEKLELKCQSEKDRSNVLSQMKVLETELEEQVNRNQELAQKTSEVSDLRQQVQALEKQLRNQRHFMDEQAIEREHERDEFQQEIQRLEEQLKLAAKSQGSGEGRGQGQLHELNVQVDSLQARVKEKADGYNLLLLGKEQLEREIAEQNEDIEKMATKIQQLEHAVVTSAEAEKRCSELEQDLLKMKRAEMELLQDKESLQKQQYNNAMQISALQSKLDEARHRFPADGDADHLLKQQLRAEQEALLIKEKEVESLAEQLEQFREELMNKTEEALQLHMQLEVQKKQSEVRMQHLEENILLQEDLRSVRGRMGLDSEGKASPLLPFPHILLEEKNQEIDHLNEQILRLQHEMKRSADQQFADREGPDLEELKSCIEHLRGDQERLRADKDEEVEQLHEVIEKLQQELALLGPIRHEISDSQDSLDELGFGAAENLKDELRKGSQASLEECHQREREVSECTKKELQQELELVCTAREALQQLLEEKEAQFRIEVEILEQNLQNVHESARQQHRDLTSLRLQHSTLQEEYHLLRGHLSQREAEMGTISARVQELEDTLRERESTLIEKELQLKTLEEERMSEMTDCEHLTAKVAELQAKLTNKEVCLVTKVEELQAVRLECSKQDLLLQDLHRKEDASCKDIDGLRADAVRLEAQIQDDSTELQALRSTTDQLGAQLQGHREKEKGLMEEMSELQRRLAERDYEVRALTEKLEQLETTKSDLKSEQDLRDTQMHLREQQSSEEVFTGSRLHEDLLSQMEAQQEEFEAEMATVKQALSHSEEKNGYTLQQLKESKVVVADFQTHSQNLKTQIKQLQETLLEQESELSDKEEHICHLKQHILELQGCRESLPLGSGSFAHLVEPSVDGHKGFAATLIDLSPWGSPEVVRQQESSPEHLHSLHAATPFSEISVAYSTDMEIAAKTSALRGDASDFLGYQRLFTDGNQYSKDEQDFRTPSFSGSNYSTTKSLGGEEIHLAGDDAAFSFTPSASQEDLRSSPSIPKAIGGYGSHTSLGSAPQWEGDTQLGADFLSLLGQRKVTGEAGDLEKRKGFAGTTNVSPQLQTMLKMVHEESCKVLALSQRPSTHKPLAVPSHQSVQSDNWQREKQTLLDTVQSLKDLITKASQRAEDPLEPRSDWRGELLHAVQVLFEKERGFLCTELRAHLCIHASGDEGSLLEKLEHIVKEQEEQQRLVLEHLLSSDRSSLLLEIQELRAQLRMTHLQNQEKLQQLQESITNAEDHGSKQEHQLRRQIELLEYKLQQETSIAGDLQTSLSREQERAAELRKHLGEEREATSQLKSDLAESKQELEHLLLSQESLQRDISRLSSTLEDKEKAVSAALQSLQTKCIKEQQQQALWEQERLQVRQREDQKTRTLQELEVALEELDSQKKQLSVALEHEQASVSNLRKELQIEQSRCEALLSQERGKLLEMQHSLELEKTHSAELSSTLQHERTLLEQLSKRQTSEELHRLQREALLEQSFVLDLQAQLEEERLRAGELAAMVEKTQQQAIQSKRQLEAEVHLCREENQKEREVSTKLRATLESLKGQKQEVLTMLEMQRVREATLQSERDQLEARLISQRDQERSKQEEREKAKRREQQADSDREKNWERDREMLQELQRQHQRDELRIKELQQTLAELEEEERQLASRKRQRANPASPQSPTNPSLAFTPDLGTVCVQQLQKMEKMRQQLLFAAIHLQEFGKNVSDRSFTDYSDEEALTSLLQMLTELKLELQRLSSLAQKPMRGSAGLADVLMVENEELTKSVIALTEEKLGLKREISTLERKLQHPLRRGTGGDQVWALEAAVPAPDAERVLWQREKQMLQNALKQSEAELAKVAAGIENRPVTEPSNSKLQRLYRKYLRAESFRKALVYQKKYLLLLLGGFQDCEEATLSMIARMGVYPSPVDLQVPATRSHAFTRFRSTVRAVIAISRLKFLVKKWQKVHKKGVPVEAQTQVPTPHSAFGIRPEVLRHSVILNSPPTRELTSCHRSNSATILSRSPKSPYLLHNRSHTTSTASPNRSRTSTQEPEHSLMEYIHHLEVIQHRLGGLQQGPSPGHSQERISKK